MRGRLDAALEEHRVRVGLELAGVVGRGHAVLGGGVGRAARAVPGCPAQAPGEAVEEAFLDGLIAGADVVDPMHHDTGAHVFGQHVDALGQGAGAEDRLLPEDRETGLGVAPPGHGWPPALMVAMCIASRSASWVRPSASVTPSTMLPSVSSIL